MWRNTTPNKQKQYRDKYNQANKQKYKEWRTNNIEHIQQYHKNWRDRNQEHITTNRKIWFKNNPHKRIMYSTTRTLLFQRAQPTWVEHNLIKILYQKRDELNKTWGCQLEVDHIIPLNPRDGSVCGLHCWANLQLLDKNLNISKRDQYETDW